MISPVKLWRNQGKIAALVGKTGAITSWTVIRVPPAEFMDQAPYPVVVVAFDDGENMMAQLVDWQPEHLTAGQRVIAVVRRTTKPNNEGIIPYGIKVKPIIE